MIRGTFAGNGRRKAQARGKLAQAPKGYRIAKFDPANADAAWNRRNYLRAGRSKFARLIARKGGGE